MIIKVLEEAGHFALVELDCGAFAIQEQPVQFSETENKFTRIGSMDSVRIFNNEPEACEAFRLKKLDLLTQLEKWGYD